MRLKVILLDDDEIVLLIHKGLLKSAQLQAPILSFLNSEEAIEYIQSVNDPNTAYLLLLDIKMPRIDGWEFLELMRKHASRHILHTVIVTSSVSMVDKKRAEDFPEVIGFFEKPLSKEKLNQLKELADLQLFFHPD